MRVPRSPAVWATAVVVLVALVCILRLGRHGNKPASKPAIADLGVTNPLNQPGGDAAPSEAYEVYSALYETPAGEPLAFDGDSAADIPQVNGSCLRPQTEQEREMDSTFEAANKQSHRWENRFAIAAGYTILAHKAALHVEDCMADAGKGGVKDCDAYKQLRHVRVLAVPGFDRSHNHALVSIMKVCGGDCGSGGIFEVERVNGRWRRAAAGGFTRECSWVY